MIKKFKFIPAGLALLATVGFTTASSTHFPVATPDASSIAVSSPTEAAAPGLASITESRASRSASRALPTPRVQIAKPVVVRAQAVHKVVAKAAPKKTTSTAHRYAVTNIKGIKPSAYTGSWYDPKYEGVRLCIINRESHGIYSVMNSQGYSGAYQFGQSWTKTIQGWTGEKVPIRYMSRYAQDYAFWRAFDHGKGKMNWNYPGNQCW